MSDLISRSELIEEINELLKSPYANQQQFGAERRETIEIVRDLCVKNQPTAYDIGNVVEELETERKTAINTYNSFNMDVDLGRVFGLEKAIKIVKKGGVSDDVCETSADKIKVTSLEVIVTGSKRKPYYEIKYKEVGADHYNIGYSSYNLDFVLDWKDKCFELVKVVE